MPNVNGAKQILRLPNLISINQKANDFSAITLVRLNSRIVREILQAGTEEGNTWNVSGVINKQVEVHTVQVHVDKNIIKLINGRREENVLKTLVALNQRTDIWQENT
jgi:hypothetical protein